MAPGSRKKKRNKGETKLDVGQNKSSEKKTLTEGEETKSSNKNTEESLWRTFYTHPIVIISTVVAIPYLLYTLRLYLILQKPNILNVATGGVLGLWRPPVTVNDERQVLIVGSMSSGTTQMSRTFNDAFDGMIEIGHENSDSEWYFVRDGTISWLHALRFFPIDNESKKEKDSSKIKEDDRSHRRLKTSVGICGNGNTIKRTFDSIDKMGFHPSMFKKSECSYRVQAMNACWTVSCLRLIYQEYGCEIRDDCEVKFRRKLFQARNPLRVVESLMVKFCDNDLKERGHLGHDIDQPSDSETNETTNTDSSSSLTDTNNNSTVVESVLHVPFLIFAEALFSDDRSNLKEGSFLTDTCLGGISYFVLRYYQIMLDALDNGYIDAMYRIEDSSVCDVANLAGFNDSSTIVYPLHLSTVQNKCDTDSFNDATLTIQHEANPINVDGKMKVGWDDLKSVGFDKDYRKLFQKMGYDPTLEVNIGTVPPSAKGIFDSEENENSFSSEFSEF